MNDKLHENLARIGNPTTCPTAIVIRDNKILTGLRNYTPDKWKDISVWTTPGGRCDEGETLEVALRREIKEEVGITDIIIEDMIGEIAGVKEGDTVQIFLCRTEQDPKLMEPEKFSEWRWVPVEEFLRGIPYNLINPPAHKMVRDYLKNKAE